MSNLWLVKAEYDAHLNQDGDRSPDKVIVEASNGAEALELGYAFHKYTQLKRGRASVWGVLASKVTVRRFRPVTEATIVDFMARLESSDRRIPRLPGDGIPI